LERLTVSANQISALSIEEFLVHRVAIYAGVSPQEVDTHLAFASMGLSSKEAVLLSGDISDWLRREVSPTLVWEYPTISEVARFLAKSP
jgi:acyl carrier protein